MGGSLRSFWSDVGTLRDIEAEYEPPSAPLERCSVSVGEAAPMQDLESLF